MARRRNVDGESRASTPDESIAVISGPCKRSSESSSCPSMVGAIHAPNFPANTGSTGPRMVWMSASVLALASGVWAAALPTPPSAVAKAASSSAVASAVAGSAATVSSVRGESCCRAARQSDGIAFGVANATATARQAGSALGRDSWSKAGARLRARRSAGERENQGVGVRGAG